MDCYWPQQDFELRTDCGCRQFASSDLIGEFIEFVYQIIERAVCIQRMTPGSIENFLHVIDSVLGSQIAVQFLDDQPITVRDTQVEALATRAVSGARSIEIV